MQSNIPEEVLPPEELQTELHLTDHMQELYDNAENITESLIFSGSDGADEDVAVIHNDGEMTYGELREQVNRFGNLLLEKGVEEGERVLIQFGNTPDFLIANYALQRINAIPVPISPLNTGEDIHYIANDSGASYAITAQENADAYNDIEYLDLITTPFHDEGYSPELEPRGAPDDFALLLYSSGTTGHPKGTLKTHQELLADGEVMRKAFELQQDDIIAGTAPASFAMGHLIFVLTAFTEGATISFVNTRDPLEIARRIDSDAATIFSAVPTSYNKILDAIDDADEEFDFSSLRIAMTGGEELKRHTYDAWKDRFGLTIDNHYGCTEILTIVLYQPPNAGMTPTHNGQPPEDIHATLLDVEDSKESSHNANSQGEFAVKAPVRVRYWDNIKEQKEAVQNGYFCMGDIFERTESEEYKFKCRKDNLIVTSGYKVSANEVENALLEHPYVEDAAVIGVPDDTRGQLVQAFVVAEKNFRDERGKGELQGYVKAKIAPYKYPRGVQFVDSIPKTDVGKIDREALKEQHNL